MINNNHVEALEKSSIEMKILHSVMASTNIQQQLMSEEEMNKPVDTLIDNYEIRDMLVLKYVEIRHQLAGVIATVGDNKELKCPHENIDS